MKNEFWLTDIKTLLKTLKSDQKTGLSQDYAEDMLNKISSKNKLKKPMALTILFRQFTSPINMILIFATILSMGLGEMIDGSIILVIIFLSSILGFFQEFKASKTVDELLKTVEVKTTVIRSGKKQQIAIGSVVPGDIALLTVGDVVPADSVIISSNNLLVDESVLTGEVFPVEKTSQPKPKHEKLKVVFKGTHVVSGSAQILAVKTAGDTEIGKISSGISSKNVSAFSRGTTEFGRMIVKIMLILTIIIFLINIVLGKSAIESVLFSLALAVGITPQMLPAITTISLSTGARRMAKKKVIVKKLEAIENLGAMSILCTDKTGTITAGKMNYQQAYSSLGIKNDDSLFYGKINAKLQSSFLNPTDSAILKAKDSPSVADFKLVDEVPYDFERRRMSVLAQNTASKQNILITKGSFRSIAEICKKVTVNGELENFSKYKNFINQQYKRFSDEGLRVIAVAKKDFLSDECGLKDENNMEFIGFLTFSDPIKRDAKKQIDKLKAIGISVKIITGDSVLVARNVAKLADVNTNDILSGEEIQEMNNIELAHRLKNVDIFAEISPMDKQRIINTLKRTGECVGFLGDGINDSPALSAADVGISVNTGADVAKAAADVILMDKSLSAIEHGVLLGRQTFANTLKYIKFTISANFGNMISMSVASLFLPFLPLLPRQILLLNFLTDFPVMALAGDSVDEHQLKKPGSWSIKDIRKFMIAFGALSAVFDIITFAVLIFVFHADEKLFQSAWFIESSLSEIAVIFSLRTMLPIFKSSPSKFLIILSIFVAATILFVAYMPGVESIMGLSFISVPILISILAITVIYIFANEILKRKIMSKI